MMTSSRIRSGSICSALASPSGPVAAIWTSQIIGRLQHGEGGVAGLGGGGADVHNVVRHRASAARGLLDIARGLHRQRLHFGGDVTVWLTVPLRFHINEKFVMPTT
jgi:hypothetical protein